MRLGWVAEGQPCGCSSGPACCILPPSQIYPLIYSFAASLHRPYRGGRNGALVGLKNYGDLLFDPQFWNAAMNSATMVVVAVTIQVVLGVALAMFFSLQLTGESIVRGILVLRC